MDIVIRCPRAARHGRGERLPGDRVRLFGNRGHGLGVTVAAGVGGTADDADEVVAAGREGGGGLVRRKPDRFPGVDLLNAARPRMRLERMIRSPKELDLPGAFTATLLWSLGADGVLDPEIDKGVARELVRQVDEHLPADLHSVLSGARAAAERD